MASSHPKREPGRKHAFGFSRVRSSSAESRRRGAVKLNLEWGGC
ncbi:hypothetical protein [Lysobacter gummosus]